MDITDRLLTILIKMLNSNTKLSIISLDAIINLNKKIKNTNNSDYYNYWLVKISKQELLHAVDKIEYSQMLIEEDEVEFYRNEFYNIFLV